MTKSGYLMLIVAVASGVAFTCPANSQGTETILHSFRWDADGGFPFAGLTADSKGNLYGTAYLGGETAGVCCGTVYQLSPSGESDWTYKVIYTFRGPVFDGEAPSGGLIADAAGNLYGTAQQGGKGLECGIVYELSPTDQGEWKEKILHEFNHSFSGKHRDGCTPVPGLIFDQSGNLFGTTESGGGQHKGVSCGGYPGYYCGTVFELTPANGKWTEKVIHRFPQNTGDGSEPYGRLVLDHGGNLWGTTLAGSEGGGTAFELTPEGTGKWTETTVFNFSSDATGLSPYNGLTIDAAGNLYGATYSGGQGVGAIFELTPQVGGGVKETLIHEFTPCGENSCPDGLDPFGGLTIDSSGNLYGTATQGGAAGTFCNSGNVQVGCGVLFKLAPAGGGAWNYSILYAFPGSTSGAYPTDDSLFVDSSGTLFGTTFVGGDVDANSQCPMEVFDEPGCGVVFKIQP